ncbi:M28 family peptidase [Hyalangium sp.]|uniref:M28 family peptidase n=1 Tax=Hyalangium sp. TaxID=2028555 RepID=UPI002D689072|nr:M28 family peptidase [Hyalangium sp.]HYI00486.1 M28 family peptidase [Hyalangium sp.]
MTPATALNGWKAWLGIAAVTAVVVAASLVSARPPAPRSGDAPLGEFSEERAWPVFLHLTRTLGSRPTGTPHSRQAATYLMEKLRELPGVEVELQQGSGVARRGWSVELVEYSARNVLVRIPGRSSDAILLSAHYDSALEGAGAGDNGMAAAAVVEVARALASGPRLERTVILNLSGAEELWCAGAHSFLEHPWSRQVRAFINLDSMGTGGRLLLFRVTPDDLWLVEAYARAAPQPHGSALAQDLFKTGVIPSGTEFAVYAEQGKLPGLDLALYEDGYAYHTALDTADRVERGTMQHLGETALAVTRELAGTLPHPGSAIGSYYDVSGLHLFTHSPRAVGGLMVLALLATAGAIVLVLRREHLRVRLILEGLLSSGLGLLASLLTAALGAAMLSLVGRTFGWFPRPWLAAVGFGGLALAGFLAMQHLWVGRALRRSAGRRELMLGTWAGALGVWGLLGILLVVTRAGAVYLPLWWLATGALGLVVATLVPRYTWVGWLIAFVPGALITVRLGTMLVIVFVPLAGRLSAGVPMDLVIALLVALPVALCALVAVPRTLETSAPGHIGAIIGGVGLLALGVMTLVPPFTAERPQRLRVEERNEAGRSTLLFRKEGGYELHEALKALPGANPTEGGRWRVDLGDARPLEQDAEITVQDPPASADLRKVKVRLHARGAQELKLKIPREALVEWSLGPLPELRTADTFYRAAHVEPPAEGWEVTLTLRGDKPVPVEFSQLLAAPSAEAQSLLERLPEWVTVHALRHRIRTLSL